MTDKIRIVSTGAFANGAQVMFKGEPLPGVTHIEIGPLILDALVTATVTFEADVELDIEAEMVTTVDFEAETILFGDAKRPPAGNEALEIAFNPRRWTREHQNAWHQNIPDIQKAFEALREIATRG